MYVQHHEDVGRKSSDDVLIRLWRHKQTSNLWRSGFYKYANAKIAPQL